MLDDSVISDYLDAELARYRFVQQLAPRVQVHLRNVFELLYACDIRVRGLTQWPRSGAFQLTLSRSRKANEEHGEVQLYYKPTGQLKSVYAAERDTLGQYARLCIHGLEVRPPKPLW